MTETATDTDRLARDLRAAAKQERRFLDTERKAERRLTRARVRLDKAARRLEKARAVYDARAGRVAELESALVVAQAERAAGADGPAREPHPEATEPTEEASEPPARRRRAGRSVVDHGTHVHVSGNGAEATAGPPGPELGDPTLGRDDGAPIHEAPEALEVRRVAEPPEVREDASPS